MSTSQSLLTFVDLITDFGSVPDQAHARNAMALERNVLLFIADIFQTLNLTEIILV